MKVYASETVQIWPKLKKFTYENYGGIMRQPKQNHV